MAPDLTTIARTYFDAWATQDFATLDGFLAADVTFLGPLGSADGRTECLAGLQRMAPMITRIEVQKIFVDGQDVLTWYLLHTRLAPPVATANWSHVNIDGLITTIRAAFDARPFGPQP